MQRIRSFLFNLIFYLMTLLAFFIMFPTLFIPRKQALCFPILWSKATNILLQKICGIRINIEGLENLPHKNGYIIASKHQSALETTVFHRIIPHTFYIFKKELLWIPLAGIYMLKTGCIPIDRKGGTRTMRQMLIATKKRLQDEMNLIIFPEGTRTLPGTKKTYSPGVALLYEQCNVPVIPVATNSGYCWPKNKALKNPGTVTIRFLKPIEPGLHRRAFLTELYDRIEEAQDQLPDPYKGEECKY